MDEYMRIVPERIWVLDDIKRIIKENKLKHTVHKRVKVAGRVLETVSIVINPKLKDTIMITGGCHGNEPAPVYAIRDYLARNKFPKVRLVIVPCINAYGFAHHRRMNDNVKNINRDFFRRPQKETAACKALVKKYKPRVVFNLHEDADEKKFFLYIEHEIYRKKAERIIKFVSKYMPHYKKHTVHQEKVVDGIINPKSKSTTFEDWLRVQGVPNFCIETPGMIPLDERIFVQGKILNNIVKFI